MTATIYEFNSIDPDSLEPIYPENKRTVQTAGASEVAMQLQPGTKHVFIKANTACNVRVGYDNTVKASANDTLIATNATALFSVHRNKQEPAFIHIL